MAFVNAFLTEEEKAEFKAKAIPNPGNKLITLKPYRWTIDREQDVFFVRGWQDREDPYDYYFLMGWKGTPINIELRQYWVKGSPRTWELIRLGLPDHLQDQRDAIIQSIKDALTVYAADGDPNEPANKIIEVKFKF